MLLCLKIHVHAGRQRDSRCHTSGESEDSIPHAREQARGISGLTKGTEVIGPHESLEIERSGLHRKGLVSSNFLKKEIKSLFEHQCQFILTLNESFETLRGN